MLKSKDYSYKKKRVKKSRTHCDLIFSCSVTETLNSWFYFFFQKKKRKGKHVASRECITFWLNGTAYLHTVSSSLHRRITSLLGEIQYKHITVNPLRSCNPKQQPHFQQTQRPECHQRGCGGAFDHQEGIARIRTIYRTAGAAALSATARRTSHSHWKETT